MPRKMPRPWTVQRLKTVLCLSVKQAAALHWGGRCRDIKTLRPLHGSALSVPTDTLCAAMPWAAAAQRGFAGRGNFRRGHGEALRSLESRSPRQVNKG